MSDLTHIAEALAEVEERTQGVRAFARAVVAFRSELLAGGVPVNLADDLTQQWTHDLLCVAYSPEWEDED